LHPKAALTLISALKRKIINVLKYEVCIDRK